MPSHGKYCFNSLALNTFQVNCSISLGTVNIIIWTIDKKTRKHRIIITIQKKKKGKGRRREVWFMARDKPGVMG